MTKIEWTNRTWNPITGCNKVSAGCKNCYAEVMHRRLMGMFPDKYTKPFSAGVEFHESEIRKPIDWMKPSMIFVNSMSDLFHEDLSFEQISHVYLTMAYAHWHTYQVLTKRPKRMLEFYQWMKSNDGLNRLLSGRKDRWPLPNVWVGVSVENQSAANERIPLLLEVPAVVRFLSCEPLLDRVDISEWLYPAEFIGMPVENYEGDQHSILANELHWVIAGGESGNRARPMQKQWVELLRDQCQAANVPFFFKQWGRYIDGRKTLNKSFNYLDGKQHLEFPSVTLNSTI